LTQTFEQSRTAERDHERRPEDPLPGDYAAINAVYATILGAVLIAARNRERGVDRITGPELLPLGAAAFSLARVIARERIGAWVREPFVEEPIHHRQPRGRRLRRALGELVTCTRCVGAWSALGLVGLRVTSPEAGRTVTAVLATSALNDFLQAAFRTLCASANSADAKQDMDPR
jgi:Protein of unknown function (DUF1360)